MLYACVFVPRFPVQASLRLEPEPLRLAWSSRPIALLDGPESLPRVCASKEEAQLAGVEVGTTKAEAAQGPGIILRQRIREQEGSAQAALVDCALNFSPRVESTALGIVTLDIEGTEKIFGPPQKLILDLAQCVARVGIHVNIAAASNPDAALLGAKGFAGTTVIPSGSEAASLAHLPVDVLPIDTNQAEILDSWGVRRCRELALLPPVPLVERLGQAGLHLQRLARGEINRTLISTDLPPNFAESVELEEPVEDLVSLALVLNRLLEQIGARLLARSLATNELSLRLRLEAHEDSDLRTEQQPKTPEYFERTLKLPVPMQDLRVLLKLLQLDLAQHSPGAAVKGISLEAVRSQWRYTQGGLFTRFLQNRRSWK